MSPSVTASTTRTTESAGKLRPRTLANFWHPVANSADVAADAPMRVTLLDVDYVVWRNGSDSVSMARDRCPHRGTALSIGSVEDGEIVCAYHGWRYNISGSCTHVPSLASDVTPPSRVCLEMTSVKERDGLIWACPALTPTTGEPPFFPSAAWAQRTGRRLVTGRPYEWNASAGQQVENVLDVAHFPFVHRDTFGVPESREIPAHTIEWHGPTRFSTELDIVTANAAIDDRRVYADLGPTKVTHYRYDVEIPFWVRLEFTFPNGGQRVLHTVATPVSDDSCSIHWAIVLDRDLQSSDDDERAVSRAVFAEDQRVIESQTPGVRIAATADFNVPADKLSIAYRRTLRDAGFPADASV